MHQFGIAKLANIVPITHGFAPGDPWTGRFQAELQDVSEGIGGSFVLCCGKSRVWLSKHHIISYPHVSHWNPSWGSENVSVPPMWFMLAHWDTNIWWIQRQVCIHRIGWWENELWNPLTTGKVTAVRGRSSQPIHSLEVQLDQIAVARAKRCADRRSHGCVGGGRSVWVSMGWGVANGVANSFFKEWFPTMVWWWCPFLYCTGWWYHNCIHWSSCHQSPKRPLSWCRMPFSTMTWTETRRSLWRNLRQETKEDGIYSMATSGT